jgi:hypothetical protein
MILGRYGESMTATQRAAPQHQSFPIDARFLPHVGQSAAPVGQLALHIEKVPRFPCALAVMPVIEGEHRITPDCKIVKRLFCNEMLFGAEPVSHQDNGQLPGHLLRSMPIADALNVIAQKSTLPHLQIPNSRAALPPMYRSMTERSSGNFSDSSTETLMSPRG